MWVELFSCLLLAHLVADFVFQTESFCDRKNERHWRSGLQYIHALIVLLLTWLVSWKLYFWWCALIIGATHLCIDIWKSYRPKEVAWFVVDQLLHVCVLAIVAWLWDQSHAWSLPWGIEMKHVVVLAALLICWKPANIFIKDMLTQYSVNMPEKEESGFKAGALIGTIERWLIMIFVCMQWYDALGLLIAAKSIIRFSEKDTAKTEYVLAGTLMSILIAVLAGMVVIRVIE